MDYISNKIVLEIGLNHLGNENYLERYIQNLLNIKKTIGINQCTLQFRKGKKETLIKKSFLLNQITILKDQGFKVGFSIEDLFFFDYLDKYIPDFFKILSWEANNIKLIIELVSFDRNIYISLGNLSDIEIEMLSNSICAKSKKISFIYTQLEGDVNKINLRSIAELRKKTLIDFSYGHHVELSDLPLYLSLAYGINKIFVYVKLDKERNHNDELNAFYFDDIDKIHNNLVKSQMYLGTSKKYDI